MKYIVYFEPKGGFDINSIGHRTVTGREYFGEKRNEIIGYENPSFASHFDSREEAKQFQEKIYIPTKVVQLPGEIKRFNKCDFVYRKFKPINKELNVICNSDDKYYILNWWIKNLKIDSTQITKEVYDSYPVLYWKFRHLYHIWRDKKSFFICFPENTVYKDFVEEFNLIIDHVEFEENGYKILQVKHYKFSNVMFYYKNENDCYVKHYGDVVKFESLRHACMYLRNTFKG